MATPRAPRAGMRLSTCLLIILMLCAGLYLALRGMGAFLITGDRLKKSDAVVVLGGGGVERMVEAANLVHERYGAWLILTEPGELEPGKGPASLYYRQLAVENGLSPFVIMITEQTVGSTYEEALSVRRLMEKHQLMSVIVVTDPFHTQRTRMIFRDVFRGSGLAVRVHPVGGHWYRSGTWFLSLDGWGNTIREYAKLLAYVTGVSSLSD